MVHIIKATDAIEIQHPVFLVFGQPGIGKSTLGYSMRDVLTLDFDLGAHRAANRRDTVQIPSWSVVSELMEDADLLEPYAALCVDTVGRCLDVMMVDIIDKTPKMARDGNLTQQGWGVLKTRFRTWVNQVRSMGKDMLLISHDREDKDGDSRIVRPDITGGSYGEVLKNADFVGYLQMVGKDRVLDFSPTDRWIGKNPAGWPPFRVPPVAKATEFMADLYAKGREALGTISEASAKVNATVDTWRQKFAGLTTAAQLNAEMPLVKAIDSPLVQNQVAKLLMDRGESLGLPFDRKAKHFTEKAEAVTA